MLHRMGGLYSEANSGFTTRSFVVPQEYLWLNEDSRQGAGARAARSYIMVGLLAASDDEGSGESQEAIPGFEPSKCVLTGASEQGMPLKWLQENGTAVGTASLVGRTVRARVLLGGGATVYSLGSGATWSNQIPA